MDEVRDNKFENNKSCGECENEHIENENKCEKGCCKPIKTYCCEDIGNARCIPILTERIYDYVGIESNEIKYLKNVEFEIISRPNEPYKNGDEICIDNNIKISYDFLGLSYDKRDKLEVIINNNIVDFIPSSLAQSQRCDCVKVYDTYKNEYDNIAVYSNCCEKGIKSTIASEVEFYICNLVITIKGKIGEQAFIAKTKSYSGLLSDVFCEKGCCAGIRPLSFIGSMCLPSKEMCTNIEIKFDKMCLSVDCVRAKNYEAYDNECMKNSFNAGVTACFSAIQKIYSTAKEELVVFASSKGIAYNNSNTIK